MWPRRRGAVAPQITIDSLAGLFSAATPPSAIASAAFPTAKKVFYLPFRLPQALVVQQLYAFNGATASGNIEVGIYSGSGAKQVSSGSVAQAGTSDLQYFDVTDTPLGVGTYYFAVSLDNTTGTLNRAAPVDVAMQRLLGAATETTGSFGLPAAWTPSAAADAYWPVIGLVPGGVV